MTPGQRSRLNSPISARQRVEKKLAVRINGEDKPPKRKSAVEVLQEELSLKDTKIAQLEGKLRDVEFEGSLFDLRSDTAQAIADTIVSSISANKAETIARAILKAIKASKAAHAG